MARYGVTIPIAGHALVTVEAQNDKDAVLVAMEEVSLKDIESWEALERFNRGNICYCPQPWEAKALLEED